MTSMVVLFSGGMDSTIALYWAMNKADKVYPICFDYGQRHRAEIQHARTIVQRARHSGPDSVFNLQVIPIPQGLIPQVGSLMTKQAIQHDHGGDEIDTSFIPHRNMLFMTIAAQWARYYNASMVVAGIRGGFPDCTEEFEKAINWTFKISDPDWHIMVTSPVHISRAESVRLAMDLPGCMDALAYSMTCFEGREPPCGKCLPCTKRAEGFAEYGIQDPLIRRLEKDLL